MASPSPSPSLRTPKPRTAPGTRAYALENAAFLRHLARTGNAREAARALDLARSRFTKRRTADPAFAVRWDAALAFAQSALSSKAALSSKTAPARPNSPDAAPGAHLVRRRDGTVQLRPRPATAITPAGEQRFLLALSATANVRLAARAAGFAHASFYARKRKDPGFAREWRTALAIGCERLELALIEGSLTDAQERSGWLRNDLAPIPPMTAAQAIQLMHLHQKEALHLDEPPHIRRRRGESHEAHGVRLGAMHEARMDRDRAAFDRVEAARRARGEPPYWDDTPRNPQRAIPQPPDPHEPPRPDLPDLAQVTGWSRADPTKTPHDATRAMFGGWRIGDWKKGREGE